MYGLFCYAITERNASHKHQEMVATQGKRLDMNDFCHDNSPYLSNYIRPRLLGTLELSSKSSPSIEATPDNAVQSTLFVGGDKDTEIIINEFGSSVDIIQRGDVSVRGEDFEMRDRDLVAPSGEELNRKQKGKEIVLNIDLSDIKDSYSDLEDMNFDMVFDVAGPIASEA